MERLQAWLVEKELAEAEAVAEAFKDPQVTEYVSRRLQYEIFNGLFSLDDGHRVLSIVDNQIQAALGMFDDAANLLLRRQALKAPTDAGDALAQATEALAKTNG
jgi:hypothetical protein